MKVKNADVLSTLVVIVYIHIEAIVTQEDPQSASFVSCSFEDGMCDWESISAGWNIGQGSPTTSGTGLADDHSLKNASGIYIYLDPKSVNTSQSRILQSPPLPWNDSCLSLWYHICGNDTGNLTVPIETKNTTTATRFSRKQSDNRALHWNEVGELDDKWHSVKIEILAQEAFRVHYVGTTNRQLSKCCSKDNCGFGFCNWIKRTSDGFRWIRTYGASFYRTTGQQSDRTDKTSDLQSGRTTKTTGPQSGRTNKTTDPQSGRTNKTTRPPNDRKRKKTTGPQSDRTNRNTRPRNRRTNKTDGVITASLVGTVIFVVLSLLVGFCVCRKRRRHRKMVETFELQPIASKPLSRDDERGYSSSTAKCINPGDIHSSKASRSGNKALINGKTDDANYKYASAFQSTTPVQWTDDTYDNTSDETKPHFDGAYDHIPTHFFEEYDATHLTTRTRLDASETNDHVTICPDDVYDEICVTQASPIQYKSYDRVTKSKCETHVSKPDISNSQDNIYEFVA